MTKLAPSLKAAAESKDDDSVNKSTPTFMVDPRVIVVVPEFNARPIDPEHVAYFKRLIIEGVDVGYLILQMIDGKPAVREGHHRVAAFMELIAEGLDIQKVKAIEFKGDEKAAILLMLATQSGKQYTPMQVGEQYIKLVNTFGMSYREIAEQRGMSEQHVKDAIRLTEQPVELKEMINKGEIKAATALKLVKREGSTAAIEQIKQAASVPGIKAGKPVTQKVLDGLGKSAVTEAAKTREACIAHLAAMVESSGFDGATKAAVRDVLALVQEKKERIVPKAGEVVRNWLAEHTGHANGRISEAASIMRDVVDKKKVDDPNSPGAKNYGHMIWLQKLAETHPKVTVRAASHWYSAVLESQNSSREIAPAPSVLGLEEALRAEMDSNGHVLAETLCPEMADVIGWARGRA